MYLDPGSGALLVQMLLGAVAGLLFFWRKILMWIKHMARPTRTWDASHTETSGGSSATERKPE